MDSMHLILTKLSSLPPLSHHQAINVSSVSPLGITCTWYDDDHHHCHYYYHYLRNYNQMINTLGLEKWYERRSIMACKNISSSCCFIIIILLMIMLFQLLSVRYSASHHRPGHGSHFGSTTGSTKAGFVGGGAFADDKRKVYSGSNPLHNR